MELPSPEARPWECTPTTPIPDGEAIAFTPVAVDANDNETAGAPVELTIDTTAPAAPAITSPADGDISNDTTPTFTGTGTEGDTISLRDADGALVCETTVGAEGTWSCTPDEPLAEGTLTVTPTATDTAGNATDGAPVTVTIDITAPEAPVITAPTDGEPTADTTPTFTGTGTEGDTIELRDPDGSVICSVTVPAGGEWSCTPTTPLPEGTTVVTPVAIDPAGNESEGTPVAVIVDTTAPVAPAITSPAPGSTTNDATPTFTGTGEDGSTVVLTDADGDTVCEAVVTGGTWSCTPTTPLPEGDFTATPTATDAAGNSTAGTPVTIAIDLTAPPAPEDVVCAVNPDGTVTCEGSGTPGNTIIIRDGDGDDVCTVEIPASGDWSCTTDDPVDSFPVSIVERDPAGNESEGVTTPTLPVVTKPTVGTPTKDTTPTFEGTAGPGDRVQLRDEAGEVVCETTAGTDGTWTCTPSAPLPEGTSTVIPVAVGADGTELAGAPFDVVVDVTPPAAPGDDTTCAQNADGTVTCSGTGEAGDTVVIRDGTGVEVCRTTIPDSGAWTCTTAGPVEADELTIVYIDPAGNESAATTVPVTPYRAAPVDSGSGSAGDSGALAFTGADVTGAGLAALALIAAGAVGLALRRRTRQR